MLALKKHYTVLFSKKSPYKIAKKYLILLAIISLISATIKFFTVAFAVYSFIEKDISIYLYFLTLSVCIMETVSQVIIFRQLKIIAVEQSAYFKREAVYDAFENMQVRHLYIAQSRLFTNLFMALIVSGVMVCTAVFSKLSEIDTYLNIFSSVSVLIFLMLDCIYTLRQWEVEGEFEKKFDLEINKILWKQYCDSANENQKLAKLTCVGVDLFQSVKKINSISALKRLCFATIDDFESVLKTIDNSKSLRNLRNVLYICPNCKNGTKITAEAEFLCCKNCQKKWRLTAGKINSNTDVVEFEKIIDWFIWQKQFTANAIEESRYNFSTKCMLYFISPTNRKIRLGEGVLLQDKSSFVFISDGGIRLELETFQNGVPFAIKDGLYFNDGKYWYLIVLPNKYDALKVNFSLKQY